MNGAGVKRCYVPNWDEIVIVETGYTDKTKEMAAKYNTKIFDFQWCDDFGKARN